MSCARIQQYSSHWTPEEHLKVLDFAFDLYLWGLKSCSRLLFPHLYMQFKQIYHSKLTSCCSSSHTNCSLTSWNPSRYSVPLFFPSSNAFQTSLPGIEPEAHRYSKATFGFLAMLTCWSSPNLFLFPNLDAGIHLLCCSSAVTGSEKDRRKGKTHSILMHDVSPKALASSIIPLTVHGLLSFSFLSVTILYSLSPAELPYSIPISLIWGIEACLHHWGKFFPQTWFSLPSHFPMPKT